MNMPVYQAASKFERNINIYFYYKLNSMFIYFVVFEVKVLKVKYS